MALATHHSIHNKVTVNAHIMTVLNEFSTLASRRSTRSNYNFVSFCLWGTLKEIVS